MDQGEEEEKRRIRGGNRVVSGGTRKRGPAAKLSNTVNGISAIRCGSGASVSLDKHNLEQAHTEATAPFLNLIPQRQGIPQRRGYTSLVFIAVLTAGGVSTAHVTAMWPPRPV